MKTEKQGNSVFEIDVIGYRAQMAEMEAWRILFEIIANAFDEDSVKKFDIQIKYDKKKDCIIFEYEDDGDGFQDWTEIFTLHKRSRRRKDPTKSGRFNLGEKQAIILAKLFRIWTGEKGFEFKWFQKTAYRNDLKPRKERGTKIYAEYDWNENDLKEINRHLRLVRAPENKECVINGNRLRNDPPIKKIKGELMTEVEALVKGNHVMQKKLRESDIELYTKHALATGEENMDADAWLFENGLPIDTMGSGKGSVCWHVNILQKIPLSPKRSNVAPNYEKSVYTVLVDKVHAMIPTDRISSDWVNEGMKNAKKDAIESLCYTKYGTSNLYSAGSDTVANDRVRGMENAHLIENSWLDKGTMDHMRSMGILKSASGEFGIGIGLDKEVEVGMTPALEKYAKVCQAVAKDCIGVDKINVKFVKSPDQKDFAAWWQAGSARLTFNLSNWSINMEYFNEWKENNVELLIHELAHHKEDNSRINTAHFSHDYVDECTRIGGIIGLYGIKKWMK